MRYLLKILFSLVCCAFTVAGTAEDMSSRAFNEALDLVHAYSGSGNELQRAVKLADGLSRSAPNSGYAQVLYAEMLSTWGLNQEGQPTEVRERVIGMSDEALKLDPLLAHAHVAKARALLRSSMYEAANSSIDSALAIDPALSGAIFLRAEVFRRTGALDSADMWYRKFIASTPSKTRKSNGYAWLGRMYQDAAWDDARNRAVLTAKARGAYEGMLDLDSGGAWKNVNFAIFLNDHAADFDAAERYAQKALGLMEFPMARYHLAAAQYQRLGMTASTMSRPALTAALTKIAESTGVKLSEAIAFESFSSVVEGRLNALRGQVSDR